MMIAKTLAKAIYNPALGGGSSLTLQETSEVLEFAASASEDDLLNLDAILMDLASTGRTLTPAEKEWLKGIEEPEPEPEPEPEEDPDADPDADPDEGTED